MRRWDTPLYAAMTLACVALAAVQPEHDGVGATPFVATEFATAQFASAALPDGLAEALNVADRPLQPTPVARASTLPLPTPRRPVHDPVLDRR